MTERSNWILEIERDLRIISERLHLLEDHFEDNGLIVQLIAAVHSIAIELEQLKARQDDGANGA